jgi:hypothetical protein
VGHGRRRPRRGHGARRVRSYPGHASPGSGGFTTILTTITVGPAGGSTGPIKADGFSLNVVIPPGTFATPVQLTVAAPTLSTIPAQPDRTVVAGAGIAIGQGGTSYQGTFLKSITASFGSLGITAGSDVAVWNGSSFATDQDGTAAAGTASVSFDTDPDFVVETPSSAIKKKSKPVGPGTPEPAGPGSLVPGATVPVTGKPVLGEVILASVLILAGAGGIAASRRRRTAAR